MSVEEIPGGPETVGGVPDCQEYLGSRSKLGGNRHFTLIWGGIPPSKDTMGVFRTLLEEATTDVVFECRACGTTLDGENSTCPYCGPTDVVCYDLT